MQVMLDTVGAEMQVVKKSEKALSHQHNDNVILTPHNGQQASCQVLTINFDGLANVKGDEDEDRDEDEDDESEVTYEDKSF
ncbi:pyruvate kinase [Tanacetum coccineum]